MKAIIQHRIPRSLPELGSRLATIQYYEKHIPLMKRVAIPLFVLMKSKTFVWLQVHAESYGDLLYLMSLQIKKTISSTHLKVLFCSPTPQQLNLQI